MYIFTKQKTVSATDTHAAQRQTCSPGALETLGVPATYAIPNPVANPPIWAALSMWNIGNNPNNRI